MEETMKCLKSSKTGEIVRVSDLESYRLVGREWQYTPKLEWKKTRPTISVKQIEEVEKKEETISEKALRRKKLGSKQRSAEDTDNHLK
jgi:hypothetical protein